MYSASHMCQLTLREGSLMLSYRGSPLVRVWMSSVLRSQVKDLISMKKRIGFKALRCRVESDDTIDEEIT